MKALIAEDNEDLRHLLDAFLTELGFQVATAKDGREALGIFENSQDGFSLLITDFNMPEMNGLELLEGLLKRNISVNKVIVISALRENEFRLKDIRNQFSHIQFIPKSHLMLETIIASI